ncbi:MAG TPA: CPBP family glutamic-type intramembrane protease [Candidatus Binataceae bacterium]
MSGVTDGTAIAAPPAAESSSAVDARKLRRRESMLLMAMAIVGILLEAPIALALKSPASSYPNPWIAIIGVASILACLVPWVLRLNCGLGLPGAPLLSARLAGQEPPFRFRSLFRVAIVYAMSSIGAALGVALVLVAVFVIFARLTHQPLPKIPAMQIAAGRLALVGLPVAIAAGVSEEIQFRFVVFALFAAAAGLVLRDSSGLPSRSAFWIATLLQGYAFGMMHLVPVAASMLKHRWPLLLGGLVMPQTWEGVILCRLYLKRGLEASILAHVMIDTIAFTLMTLGTLVSQGAGH